MARRFPGQRRYFELLVRLQWMDSLARTATFRFTRRHGAAQKLPVGDESPPRLI